MLDPAQKAALRWQLQTVEADKQVLARMVYDLRSDGASWADIGDAFGITRQSACERWGRGIPEVSHARQ